MAIEINPQPAVHQDDSTYFHFNKPIRSVAVIGGGPSGITAVKHLADANFKVRLFERQSSAGGIWTFNADVPLPSTFPTPPPSRGDFTPELPEEEVTHAPKTRTRADPKREVQREFNPPNPVYWNLVNNIPTPAMEFKDFPWPPNTDWYLPHTAFASYVQRYAEHFDLNAHASFNTRVENVRKLDSDQGGWRLTLRKLEAVSEDREEVRETFWTEDFDAVVVASGHYGAPFIPAIEGQEEWALRWPEWVFHSRAYRKPETYQDKTVLLIGTGTSGVDIAIDLSPFAAKVYQVTRDQIVGPEDYMQFRSKQTGLLPSNGELIPEIRRFLPPLDDEGIEKGRIELTDGRIITGVDAVIFSTGFQYSFPFLPDFHHDLGTPQTSTHQHPSSVLITNGAGIHNVYRDVFYIPDPTLTFLGLSINTPTFSFFEFQSLAIARVFSGHARLPGLTVRKDEYVKRLEERGGVKWVHFLGGRHMQWVNDTVEWINNEAEIFGVKKITGYSELQQKIGPKVPELVWKKYQLGAKAVNEYARTLFRGEEAPAKAVEA